ncbi:family 20 glycosylhydrolase [Capillibacterium thermochitinicola]|uniref:Family 20 glycosylhydrolase n=1 Tax=Capillibacterium thermochitinicola TaxID=2699427 RepID=A0A8J6I036_9FIRM|nr:family 20 glycosylhydrolase [Capillibacterium thermochitinicola]
MADQPRFPWRGLLIDCARHFQPVNVIKRNLDGMAAVKLNVLHWHLTDDQGFRVESKVFPRLHQEGANGQYYTQEQIREIIAYADRRGIRVVPEFDLPGHTSSWVLGYPELASAPGPHHPEIGFGVKDTVLNPVREETYAFLEAFFQEMAALFPDEYIHIGGDENNGKQWAANPEIQAFMHARGLPDTHSLQAYFNRRLHAILTKLKKKMVGWDEILAPDLPASTIVIQAWRNKESLWQAAKMGYKRILSHNYYLDLMLPAAFHYQNDPLAQADHITKLSPFLSFLLHLPHSPQFCTIIITIDTHHTRHW